MSVNGPDPRRRTRRLKIFTPALLVQGEDRRRIHLLDISRGGALAYAEAPPPLQARVRVRCAPLHVQAVVAWVAGKRFGLAFSVPIDEALLRAIIDAEPRSAADGAFGADKAPPAAASRGAAAETCPT